MPGRGRGAGASPRGANMARDRAMLVTVRALARAVDILGATDITPCQSRPRGGSAGQSANPARGEDANQGAQPAADAPADILSAARRRRERRARALARAASPGWGNPPAAGGAGAAGVGSREGAAQARPATGSSGSVDPGVEPGVEPGTEPEGIRALARVLGEALRVHPTGGAAQLPSAPRGGNRAAQLQRQQQQRTPRQERQRREPLAAQPTPQQPPPPAEAARLTRGEGRPRVKPGNGGAPSVGHPAGRFGGYAQWGLETAYGHAAPPGHPSISGAHPAPLLGLSPTAAPFPPGAGGAAAAGGTHQHAPEAAHLKRQSSPRGGDGAPTDPHPVGRSPPSKMARPLFPLRASASETGGAPSPPRAGASEFEG